MKPEINTAFFVYFLVCNNIVYSNSMALGIVLRKLESEGKSILNRSCMLGGGVF